MELKGLCSTCVQAKTCIFEKEPPVLQCEEFSFGNHAPISLKLGEIKRVFSQEVALESE